MKTCLDKPYSGPNSFGDTYGEHRKNLELSDDDWYRLATYSKKLGIDFFASTWDIDSADFMEKLNIPAYKIASADVTNLPLIEHIAQKKKPVILSTGMSTLQEIDEAVETIIKYTDQIILLHCISAYPFDDQYANLNIINALKKRYDFPIGYSGHEKSGHVISLIAVALGACFVERHFTLDHTMRGPDHAASLEQHGFSDLLVSIRKVEKSLGSAKKEILEIEVPVREKLAKSIVINRTIKKGHIIKKEDLEVKGPGTGLKPKYINKLIVKKQNKIFLMII
ncbi:MAG: N-acetylneuraminate synthase family protein [Euryarchaeota archaeon]|nr:N-acetylneuraminate synthase family protein [Euryarchaeota archaeon]